MNVTDALAQSESDLARLLNDLQLAKELVASLEQDVKNVHIEIAGLKSYSRRMGLTHTVDAEPGADVVPISGAVQLAERGPDIALMTRTDAVVAAMRSAPGPVDRNTIHEYFVDGGRFDDINDISLTLSGLKRAGRAHKLGQGLWQLVANDDSVVLEAN